MERNPCQPGETSPREDRCAPALLREAVENRRRHSNSPLGQLLLRPLQVKTGTFNIYSLFHLCHWFTDDGFGQVQEKVSSALTSKNLQSSWGNMMGAQRIDMSMCTTGKGELCAQGYPSKSVSQITFPC